MSKTVVAVFSNERVAEEAVSDLRRAGFDKEISLLAKEERVQARQDRNGGADDEGEGLTMRADTDTVSNGATTGGVLGGLAGLALGAGALAIPGIGPLVAAGPIAGLLSGAASGGLAGGLIDWGIPAAESRRYEEDLKQGKILVAVKADPRKVDEAADILRNHGADNVRTH